MSDPFSPGLLFRLPQTVHKVAIVRASRIGDFVCATPAFRALRTALPEAKFTLIGMPFVEELVTRSPHLDRFVPFPGFPGIAEQFFDARKATTFFQQMQSEDFDLAIQLHGSGVYSNPFTLMLGAKLTAGYVRSNESSDRLEAAFPFPYSKHEVRRGLAFIEFLGAKPQGEQIEFPLLPEDYDTANKLLAHCKPPLIGLHPAAREITKRWHPDRFIQVGRILQNRYHGTIVIIGGKEEWQLAESIAQAIGQGAVNFAGKTSLSALGALISRLSLLITNDSGPAHIAYAIDTPTITIFGATDPQVWGSLNSDRHITLFHSIECHPCDLGSCAIGLACLEGIQVEPVIEKAIALLESYRSVG